MPRYYGTEGGDRWKGTFEDERADGYEGDDVLRGMDGDDQLLGQAGDDRLNGDNGDDVLMGGEGADFLIGGRGTDYASYVNATGSVAINIRTRENTGEAEGDVFFGIERFRLSSHDDGFIGGIRDDWVAGYAGRDGLDGGGGDDTLNGGDGDDLLIGGRGADKLIGEAGDDTMSGGVGADQFYITGQGFGNDLVDDFKNGEDVIRVVGFDGVDDISDLVISANGSGWAVITFPDGSSLTLKNIAVADVDATDFLWI